ncbi:hypothetical protein SODALDRAFT_326557 [Sodiomyces alkalinus F11]|uniref:Uncharacterized protein n=1 Tax=Sodiomyces alkalinus (strain CBS 110278 / VKM F-3762 / F11) TaxID=1314773 RepID=A0A3N2Q6H7_SODAK|nr:hypothetical protein SODALDRAFT_326557 [Sodiomyces alkalinus F11]ROT42393.1 hypothetical protein SODALDRAFT_326557 [Sodiomyces alkalinus F11]
MASENPTYYNNNRTGAPVQAGYENPATTDSSLNAATNPNAAKYQPPTAGAETSAATTATAGESRFDPTTPAEGTTSGHGIPPSSAAAPAAGTNTTTSDTAAGRRQSRGFTDTVKGAMAQGHGLGEAARGSFNAKVDELMGDETGRQKDQAVVAGGKREFTNKEFERKGWDKAL